MAQIAPNDLYIIYNADSSMMGKLRYAYRKITSDKQDEPACAACDITHGGLSIHETEPWLEAKKKLEASDNVRVTQLHRDELSAELKEFVDKNEVKLPVVVLKKDGQELKVVVDHAALASCRGDAASLIERLKSTVALD